MSDRVEQGSILGVKYCNVVTKGVHVCLLWAFSNQRVFDTLPSVLI